jgi:hypothetical protein
MHPPIYPHSYEAILWEGSVYCLSCIPPCARESEISPIYAESVWDTPPACENCGKIHDYMEITQKECISCGTWHEENPQVKVQCGPWGREGICPNCFEKAKWPLHTKTKGTYDREQGDRQKWTVFYVGHILE